MQISPKITYTNCFGAWDYTLSYSNPHCRFFNNELAPKVLRFTFQTFLLSFKMIFLKFFSLSLPLSLFTILLSLSLITILSSLSLLSPLLFLPYKSPLFYQLITLTLSLSYILFMNRQSARFFIFHKSTFLVLYVTDRFGLDLKRA